jgi:hypothetical protein
MLFRKELYIIELQYGSGKKPETKCSEKEPFDWKKTTPDRLPRSGFVQLLFLWFRNKTPEPVSVGIRTYADNPLSLVTSSP